MNAKKLVMWSNRIVIFALIALIYWFFIISSITGLNLKIFDSDIMEIFGFSILGIFLLMAGALILNIMLNLTRIADYVNRHDERVEKTHSPLSWGKLILFILSFPLILGLMISGHYYSRAKLQNSMLAASTTILDHSMITTNAIAEYQFTLEWLQEAKNHFKTLSNIDRYFPGVSLIVQEELDGKTIYLTFNEHSSYTLHDKKRPLSKSNRDQLHKKNDYLYATSQVERNYLADVFQHGEQHHQFLADGNHQKLFVPYHREGKPTVLFLFSEYQYYGNIGSKTGSKRY